MTPTPSPGAPLATKPPTNAPHVGSYNDPAANGLAGEDLQSETTAPPPVAEAEAPVDPDAPPLHIGSYNDPLGNGFLIDDRGAQVIAPPIVLDPGVTSPADLGPILSHPDDVTALVQAVEARVAVLENTLDNLTSQLKNMANFSATAGDALLTMNKKIDQLIAQVAVPVTEAPVLEGQGDLVATPDAQTTLGLDQPAKATFDPNAPVTNPV